MPARTPAGSTASAAEGRLATSRHSAIALAAAAIEAYEDEEEVARQRLLATAHGGRPQVQHGSGRPLDLKLRGVGYRVSVARIGHKRFRVGISAGGSVHPADVEIERFDSHSSQITVNGQRYRLVTGTHGPIHLVEVDGVAHRVSRDEGGVVRSPAPALVVATPVCRRGRGRSERAGPGAGEHEDGDGAALAVPRPGAGAAGLGRQPGGDGRGAAAPGAAGRRRGGGGGRRQRQDRRDRAARRARRRGGRRPRRARHAGPAQPAARLRRRPARPAPHARPAIWPRAPSWASPAGRWPPRSSCSGCSRTCPS